MDNLVLPETSTDNVIDLRQTGGDGQIVTAELRADEDIGTRSCLVSGYAIG